ncbi:MAG: hypothetical protein H7X97_08595 [Opitutaceae bacterium]|nr:hypothetical protein [Verrucomicrobiales bacterium]
MDQEPQGKTAEPPEGGRPMVHVDTAKQPIAEVLKSVVSPERGITIVHCHLPGDPASEQLADIFNLIKKKYGRQVDVIRAGFKSQPENTPGQAAMKLPHVIMITGSEKVFEFQGLWTQAKVEKKVDELLFGLRRVDKNWRPVVPGMKPKGS